MIEALIEKVWSNPALPTAIDTLERSWLSQVLRLEDKLSAPISLTTACRYIEAAAILACSERPDQRLAAYRMATYAYELFRGKLDGLDSSVRAILTRLGNFPSVSTVPAIDAALSSGPWIIAEEEIKHRLDNQVMLSGKPIVLTDFQKVLWKALTEGSSLAIAAPTSTGKSFILQAYLSHKILGAASFSACYVVPTRALITQVQNDISDEFDAADISDVEVVTVPLEEGEPLPGRAVYVFTQERLALLLKNHPTAKVDFLIVDEAHSVQDGDRGIILQSAIDELVFRNQSLQLLFASPSVSNLDIFGRMTGRPDVATRDTDQITVSQNFIDVEVTSATRGELKIYSRTTGERREIGSARIDRPLASRVECLVHVAHRFGADKQSIVFADGQADAEKLAFQISDLRSQEIDSGSSGLEDLAQLAKEAVHPKYLMAITLKNGVAFHYGNIPTILRTAVEQAFLAGKIQYIVCTSTLLAGVNLPARNLFLCKPKRMKGTPLESVDFWNLAGRAGRLKKEFQGNIYLVNYSKWDAQPLNGPRRTSITPAIQSTIQTRAEELEKVIRNSDEGDAGLETIFVRLLVDFKQGRLGATLNRAGFGKDEAQHVNLEEALNAASQKITLPADVLNASPTISAHRQQRLYDLFNDRISKGGEAAGRQLLLAHPRETLAFDNYVEALRICHGTILPKPGTEKQNRFFALMLIKWMRGIPISELIDGRASFYRSEPINITIRKTLELVETELRFNYVRAFGCYAALLSEALSANGLSELQQSLPSIALYLEIGASDKTMISFVALGLSRLTASRLTNLCADKTLNVSGARAWLARQDLEVIGFSRYIRDEVEGVLRRKSA